MDTRAPSAHAQHMVKLVKPNSVTSSTHAQHGEGAILRMESVIALATTLGTRVLVARVVRRVMHVRKSATQSNIARATGDAILCMARVYV